MRKRLRLELIAGYCVFGILPNVVFHACKNHTYAKMSLDQMNTEEMRGIYKMAADNSANNIFSPSVLVPFSFVFKDRGLPYEEYTTRSIK